MSATTAVASYVWQHIVAFVALLTTWAHIARTNPKRKPSVPSLASLDKFGPIIFSALAQAGAFEAGQTVSISVPAESLTIDVPDVGKVVVAESGTTLTFTKAK